MPIRCVLCVAILAAGGCASHSPSQREGVGGWVSFVPPFSKVAPAKDWPIQPSLAATATSSSVALCYDPTSPPDLATRAALEHALRPAPAFNLQGSRWPGMPGGSLSLTWSLVPDGLSIPVAFDGDNGNAPGPSTLFAQMDAAFGGQRSLWIALVQQAFDRWSQLTGVQFTRVSAPGQPWDDGAPFASAPAAANLRGDIRLAARNVDAAGRVLAYAYFPANGDLVLDISENWSNPTSAHRFLRNAITHELGHALGLAHVCPNNATKLLEPFLTVAFDGPQHDDLRAVFSLYGDAYEPNNSVARAVDLGVLSIGGTFSPSLAADAPNPLAPLTALDTPTDVDLFRVSQLAAAAVTLRAEPVGALYDSSTQNSDSSCNVGNIIDSRVVAPLRLQLLAANGTTVLASADAAPGAAAQISSFVLSSGAFFVRVASTQRPPTPQMYALTISSAPVPPPANDDCANAQPLGVGLTPIDLRGATNDYSAVCSKTQIDPDAWFRFRPTSVTRVLIDLCGSDFDTALSAYARSCGILLPIACNNDQGPTCATNPRASALHLVASPLNDTLLRVAGVNGQTGRGALRLTLACVADLDSGDFSGRPDGGVTIDDLLYFLFAFQVGHIHADVDDGSNTGSADGGVTIDDLFYYLARFESGC